MATQGEVTARFEDPTKYEKGYFDGDAAGAISYKPIGEQAVLEPDIERWVWDPMIHRYDLPPEHSGLLLPIHKKEAADVPSPR